MVEKKVFRQITQTRIYVKLLYVDPNRDSI
jgi:hypothetical protein